MKHLLAALLLLAAGLGVAEVWLQCQTSGRTSPVCSQVCVSTQQVLVPSQITHHELRRMSTVFDSAACQDSGDKAFVTNSYGLRGPEPSVPKDNSVYRILMLGDDTVLGSGLAAEDTVCRRLQLLLSERNTAQIEVINAGVPGYSPLLSVLQFEHELQRLQPDLVILHFDMSDVSDDSVYRRYLKTSQESSICTNPWLEYSRNSGSVWQQVLQRSALAEFCHTKAVGILHEEAAQSGSGSSAERYAWTLQSPPDLRVQIQHAFSPVTRLQQVLAARGTPLYVSTAPVFWQVVSPDLDAGLAARFGVYDSKPVDRDLPFQILDAFCRQKAITFCNPLAAFREFPESAELFDTRGSQVRLSRYGAALYARELARTLLAPASRDDQLTTSPAYRRR
jgi:hypothetical protein